MPRREVPQRDKNSVLEKERAKISRRYKVDLSKRRKILPGQMEFVVDHVIILKLVNYSNTQIAKIVGLSRGQVKELLTEPDVADRFLKLKENLAQGAYDLIQTYMIDAVQAIANVMNMSTDDAMILKAAADLLDRGGVAKTSRTESKDHILNESRTTFAVDEEMMAKLHALPPEKQEQAAQMVEQLEQFLAGQVSEGEINEPPE